MNNAFPFVPCKLYIFLVLRFHLIKELIRCGSIEGTICFRLREFSYSIRCSVEYCTLPRDMFLCFFTRSTCTGFIIFSGKCSAQHYRIPVVRNNFLCIWCSTLYNLLRDLDSRVFSALYDPHHVTAIYILDFFAVGFPLLFVIWYCGSKSLSIKKYCD